MYAYILASSIYIQVNDSMQVVAVHKAVGGSHLYNNGRWWRGSWMGDEDRERCGQTYKEGHERRGKRKESRANDMKLPKGICKEKKKTLVIYIVVVKAWRG